MRERVSYLAVRNPVFHAATVPLLRITLFQGGRITHPKSLVESQLRVPPDYPLVFSLHVVVFVVRCPGRVTSELYMLDFRTRA